MLSIILLPPVTPALYLHSMHAIFSAEAAIRHRSSIRNFEAKPLSDSDRQQLASYITGLRSPFPLSPRIALISAPQVTEGRKLGTYGVIKGAVDYLAAAIPDEPMALEALGYALEELVLYAESLGLGTCWLGGTFKRGAFAQAFNCAENELFPAVIPIGYPLNTRHLTESFVRFAAKSHTRKAWKELFYYNDASTPLTEQAAAAWAVPLELLRVAPSASNRQPWRVILRGKTLHCYQNGSYGEILGNDLHRIDMGIAACHLALACREQGLNGQLAVTQPSEDLAVPAQWRYSFSWVAE